MHWVVQNNIYREDGYESLINALDSLKLPYSVHRCAPFLGTLDPEPVIPDGSQVVVMGGVSIGVEARRRGWRPGVFHGNSFSHYRQVHHWGEWMLNHDAWFGSLGQVKEQGHPFFIRTEYDDKAFNGQVMDWPQFLEWRERVCSRTPEDNPTVNMATKVVVAPKKEIFNETRVWIIDGKAVTASLYKTGTRKRCSEVVLPSVLTFAESMAKKWMPHRAYVIDIADTPNGLKAIEVNTLNSSGFYACNVQKLIMAIENALW
jgi:hypothetical protein